MNHLLGIDVILKMDWLWKNHTIIDYKRKNVYLSIESENERNRLLFHGKKHAFHPCIIFLVKVTKNLKKVCQRFIASVVEPSTEQQEVDASSMRVVTEYLDAFPEELLELPPQRELEFSIDLLMGNSNF